MKPQYINDLAAEDETNSIMGIVNPQRRKTKAPSFLWSNVSPPYAKEDCEDATVTEEILFVLPAIVTNFLVILKITIRNTKDYSSLKFT